MEMNSSDNYRFVVSTIKIFEVLTGMKQYTLLTTIYSLTLFTDESSDFQDLNPGIMEKQGRISRRWIIDEKV
jgi:hypothetical protein